MAKAGEDHSFVADAQNWEKRVEFELKSSKTWFNDWGSLYAPEMPTNYEERIAQLRKQADAITGATLQTNNNDYGQGKPFAEFHVKKEKKPDLM